MYLTEGIEHNDLKRLINPILSIDRFRSKMGEDKDIIVLCFTVLGKEPATDLVNFIEKSYDWVLDADLSSSSEEQSGNYTVFVELAREHKASYIIFDLINDLLNLTGQSLDEWTFTYYKSKKQHPITKKELAKVVITDSDQYEQQINVDLDKMRMLAGVKIKSKPVDDELADLQRKAGIK
jgi:hypothetical protein